MVSVTVGSPGNRTPGLPQSEGDAEEVLVFGRISGYSFGSVRVNGVTYDHNMIIDSRKIRKRKKGAYREFRSKYGHTPLGR